MQLSTTSEPHHSTGAPQQLPDGSAFSFSVFSRSKPLGKKITRQPDGTYKKIANADLFEGSVRTVQLSSLADFAALRDSLTNRDALACGVTRHPTARVVTKDKLALGRHAGPTIARDKEHMVWPVGVGLLAIDYDPQPAHPPLSPDDLYALVCAAWPGVDRATVLATPSGSSCIHDAETGREVFGVTGQRLYVLISDAARVPDMGALLFDRLVLAGHGYVRFAADGKMMLRTHSDAQMHQPERLDFAKAECGKGLVQRLAPGRIFESSNGLPADLFGDSVLDVDSMPALTTTERERLDKIEAALLNDPATVAESARCRVAWATEKARKSRPDATADELREVVADFAARAEGGQLVDSFPLEMQDGSTVTVADVLADPERFDNIRCADPADGGDDRRVAQIKMKRTNGRGPTIYSHLHGGRFFDLVSLDGFDDVADTPQITRQISPERHTAKSIIESLSTQPRGAVLSTWAEPTATLRPDAAADVIEHVERATGVGRRALSAALRDARRTRTAEWRKLQAGDRRVLTVEPENTYKQAAEVGRLILARAGTDLPLVQHAGRTARVVESEPPFAHAHDDDAAPPPLQVRIEGHTRSSMLAEGEAVVVFQNGGREGPKATGIPAAVVDHLLQGDPATAPQITGLVAHAFATPRGDIVATNGLHAETGLVVHGVAGRAPEVLTQVQARAARQRLREIYLDGFEFASPLDAEAALAGLFTGVQRQVLDIAPALAILAATQSSGKTTMARREHVVLTGRDAAMMTLRVGHDDEIEKAVLATLLGAPPMLLFDNVPDGFTLNIGPLNTIITAPAFEGRMLGSTRMLSVSTATHVVFTGNNLKLGPDEGSRVLVTRLAPGTARPETRRFKNADVLEHARSLREPVLRDVVGIVAGYLRSGERVKTADGSRFPQWDRQVRQALMWAGGLDVAQVFRNNTQDADHLQGLRALLRELRKKFGSHSFTARDVVERCCRSFDDYAVRDALEALQSRDTTSARSVGRVLAAYCDRTTEIDGAAVRLTRRVDRDDVGRFHVG